MHMDAQLGDIEALDGSAKVAIVAAAWSTITGGDARLHPEGVAITGLQRGPWVRTAGQDVPARLGPWDKLGAPR